MPKTYNSLQTSKGKLVVHRLTDINYWIQTFTLPGVQLERLTLPGMRRDVPIAGAKFEYDPINVGFIVDQDMSNYNEIINWMNEFQGNFTDIRDLSSTLSINILNGDNAIQQTFGIKGAYPTTISEVEFITTDSTMTPSVCNVTFNYTHINIDGIAQHVGY